MCKMERNGEQQSPTPLPSLPQHAGTRSVFSFFFLSFFFSIPFSFFSSSLLIYPAPHLPPRSKKPTLKNRNSTPPSPPYNIGIPTTQPASVDSDCSIDPSHISPPSRPRKFSHGQTNRPEQQSPSQSPPADIALSAAAYALVPTTYTTTTQPAAAPPSAPSTCRPRATLPPSHLNIPPPSSPGGYISSSTDVGWQLILRKPLPPHRSFSPLHPPPPEAQGRERKKKGKKRKERKAQKKKLPSPTEAPAGRALHKNKPKAE